MIRGEKNEIYFRYIGKGRELICNEILVKDPLIKLIN